MIYMGDISIAPTDTLIIMPGVTVFFTGYHRVIVEGLLQAIGSEADSIFFTTDSLANPDLWAGLSFQNANDSCRMDYCVMQWGLGSAIAFENSTAILYNCCFNSNYSEFGGAAVRCVNSSVSFNQCHMTNNRCYVGSIVGAGAVLVYFGSTACFRECTFTCNRGVGGAVGIVWDSNASFSHCLFQQNWESAVYCDSYDSWATFSDCDFIENSSFDVGGAIFFDQIYGARQELRLQGCSFIGNHADVMGGAISCGLASMTLDSCDFISNRASSFGGIFLFGSAARFNKCTFSRNLASSGSGGAIGGCNAYLFLNKCIFDSNSAAWQGGGLQIAGMALIERCTLSGNRADAAGGTMSIRGVLYLNSSIVANTTTREGLYFDGDTSDVHVLYCDFYGNAEGDFGGAVPPSLGRIVTTNANGDSCDIFYNIFLDPLFTNPEQEDFTLLRGSPCIDAADPAFPRDPDSTIADIGAFFFNQSGASEVRFSPPQIFALWQNYPNPFNSSTRIVYEISQRGLVQLTVFNLLGQKVTCLVNGIENPGCYEITFDGRALPSGLYFYAVEANGFRQTRRMVLLR